MAISTRAGAGKAAGGKRLSKDQLAAEVARAVGAGRSAAVETVDFGDPNRPKVCLEVDFPILRINEIAAIESSSGAATKPIYQMMKWWARRPSSVFRSLLLSAATKAPADPTEASRLTSELYYANAQKKHSFDHLKVADIFMGGGTTVVEGARLGMQVSGNDLNPVAWLVVKNAMSNADPAAVDALTAQVEAAVKPQLMPYYACECPRGHKGTWTRASTGETMTEGFDALALTPEERIAYRYTGPEIVYVFWAKHGPCQVTGCGHRTPLMSSPVLATKSLTVRVWSAHKCGACRASFDVEDVDARMAPSVPLVVAPDHAPYAPRDSKGGVTCPSCGFHDRFPRLSEKAQRKKVELTLLVHPEWLAGEHGADPNGAPYGGSVTDDASATAKWNAARACRMRLLEVRGPLPEEVSCPETGVTFRTAEGTIPKQAAFACGSCGTAQDLMPAVKASGKSAPAAAYAIQGYCPACDANGACYGGRFFAPVTSSKPFDAAEYEWEQRRDADLSLYWPRSEIPFGHMTHQRQPLPQHGYLTWRSMFNARQLLAHSLLLQAIATSGAEEHGWDTREALLGAFQQYLRFNCMFTVYHPANDQATKHFANNNFHPRNTLLEVSVFAPVGDGRWISAAAAVKDGLEWRNEPWELVPATAVSELRDQITGKSEKVFPGDRVRTDRVALSCGSSSDLALHANESVDLVVTDPPFGGLIHYSELADYFYVWLRLVLRERYPEQFGPDFSPKTLEAVTNVARQPENADAFYKRLLTECWRESHRILKAGGILAFTFHHSEDEPWVAVLESLFDAGFYLEATYPIRADTSMDSGQFGSKTIEYDIVHVCRKRTEEPTPVSWARMRRRVLDDVRQLQTVLENHAAAGLPTADLKVIKRGKALEYYSRHYGKVYVDEIGKPFSVRDALIGINQLLDDDGGAVKEPPPGNTHPFTRQFLSLFRGVTRQPRDQVQKDLRGTGYSPAELVERGWCTEEKKTFYVKEPRLLAAEWYKKHRRNMTSDYDQAAFLIGAASDGSGINLRETLNNENFRPHPALKALLDWHTRNGATKEIRAAAQRAHAIYVTWEQEHPGEAAQLAFFAD